MGIILHQWLLSFVLSVFHPFFVSMTDMNYNAKEKSLEISVRIFTDDFENTIRLYHKDKIDILHPANQQLMNSYVNDYIQKHLHLKIDGKDAVLSFVGYEQQNESIWTYFEVKNIAAPTQLNINNSLLHDYKKEQINMLHAKVNDKEQSYKLDYPETDALFSFR
jgi:hypothetical protein